MTNRFARPILLAILLVFSLFPILLEVGAQRRDFVTEPEAELIRERQEIDARIDVLMKFIDRRLAVAGIAGANWTPPKKNPELWGEEPTGTRLQLLTDVKRILQKAVDDIDDIASRDSAAIEGNEKGGKVFPKAVRHLAANVTRFRTIFQAELAKAPGEAEKGILLQSIELSDQIIEAAANLPAEVPKQDNKKKKYGS